MTPARRQKRKKVIELFRVKLVYKELLLHPLAPSNWYATFHQFILQSNLRKRPPLNNDHLGSISSTFYSQFFCTNVHFGSFYYLRITRKSCRNDVCTKNARVLRWWNCHLPSGTTIWVPVLVFKHNNELCSTTGYYSKLW